MKSFIIICFRRLPLNHDNFPFKSLPIPGCNVPPLIIGCGRHTRRTHLSFSTCVSLQHVKRRNISFCLLLVLGKWTRRPCDSSSTQDGPRHRKVPSPWRRLTMMSQACTPAHLTTATGPWANQIPPLWSYRLGRGPHLEIQQDSPSRFQSPQTKKRLILSASVS